jgi:hypothetical protein
MSDAVTKAEKVLGAASPEDYLRLAASEEEWDGEVGGIQLRPWSVGKLAEMYEIRENAPGLVILVPMDGPSRRLSRTCEAAGALHRTKAIGEATMEVSA